VSAVGAAVSMWSGTKGLMTNIVQNAMPLLRSRLKLQRCSKKSASDQDAQAKDRGSETIPGLGTRKQEVLKNSGTVTDLAIAMLETKTNGIDKWFARQMTRGSG